MPQRRELPAFRFKNFSVEHNNSSIAIGTDAVLLGAWADTSQKNQVLEVGCGCGVISLVLAQKLVGDFNILAIDIDEKSVLEANENFKNSKWGKHLETVLSDFKSLKTSLYDLIICNPPFFRDSLQNPETHKNLARHQLRFEMTDFAKFCHLNIVEGGEIYLIYPYSDLDFLKETFENNSLFLQKLCIVFSKKSKDPNRVLCCFGKESMDTKVSELSIYNPDNSYTQEYQKVTQSYYLNF